MPVSAAAFAARVTVTRRRDLPPATTGDGENAFDHRRQLAELEYLVSSRAAMTSLAENYVGGPLD